MITINLLALLHATVLTMQIIPYDSGASEAKVQAIESLLGTRLPSDYREFLLVSNGGRPDSVGAKGGTFKIAWRGQSWSWAFEQARLEWLYTTNDVPNLSLAWVHDKHAFAQMRMLVPADTIPIGRDRGPNAVLLGIAGENRGKVFFWVSDYAAEDGEASYENVGFVADSFSDFLQALEIGAESTP